MKLVVTCPMYWPTTKDAHDKAWLYLASAEKAGVAPEQLKPYGIGSAFYPGTATMRIYDQVQALDRFDEMGFTHALFSDAWDMLFVQPLEVLVDKYRSLGSPPMLTGASPLKCGFGDVHEPELYEDLFDLTKPFPFPTFFHISEIRHVRDQLKKIPKGAHNESYVLVEALRNGMEFVIDHGCEIFQECGVHHGGEGTGMVMKDRMVYNEITGSNPCMVHFGGGHVDPDTGKDAAMLPLAKALGIVA